MKTPWETRPLTLTNTDKHYLTKVKRRLHHPMVKWSEVFARNFVDVTILDPPTYTWSSNFQQCVGRVVILQHLKIGEYKKGEIMCFNAVFPFPRFITHIFESSPP